VENEFQQTEKKTLENTDSTQGEDALEMSMEMEAFFKGRDGANMEQELLAKSLDAAERSTFRLAQLREATGKRIAADPRFKGSPPSRWFPQLMLDNNDHLEKLKDLCIQVKTVLPYRTKDKPEALGVQGRCACTSSVHLCVG
jgi:hypothetical protein